MEVKLVKLLEPRYDLASFRGLVADLNSIDAQRLPPQQKFAEAVDELLHMDAGEKHCFVAFYFSIPFPAWIAIGNFQFFAHFRLSCRSENIMVVGVMTGPLDLWRKLFQWMKETKGGLESLAQTWEKLL